MLSEAANYRRVDITKKRAGKIKAGEVFKCHTIGVRLTTGEQLLYWFREPDGFSDDDAKRLLDWIYRRHANVPGVELHSVELHGPFKTDAEVAESQRLTLLGPQCEVTEGGMWDPAWDRPQ